MKPNAPTSVAWPLVAALAFPLAALATPAHVVGHRVPRPLLAQAAAQIDVFVIEASNGPGGIDPALRSITQLTHPPFSAYSQLHLVNRTTVPLGATPSTVPFGSGDSVSVAAPGQRPTGRYSVNVELTRGGRTHEIQFGASPNTPFFTAVTTGPNTALVLGFVVH